MSNYALPTDPVLDSTEAFLRPLIAAKKPYSHRPFVTLTYAQSLDGKIAGKEGKQLLLSGKESREMTHRLRTMHNGILIGIDTLINDDPLLTARDLPPPSNPSRPHPQPTPIILDARCRFPLTSRLLTNYKNGTGKRPWVVCDPGMCRMDRRIEVEEAGCRILIFSTKGTGIFDLLPLLERFTTSITHLMVEGGSRVISSFLTCPKNVVDLVIVTIAPVLVGEDGVGVAVARKGESLPEIVHETTAQFGKDTVLVCKIRHRERFS